MDEAERALRARYDAGELDMELGRAALAAYDAGDGRAERFGVGMMFGDLIACGFAVRAGAMMGDVDAIGLEFACWPAVREAATPKKGLPNGR